MKKKKTLERLKRKKRFRRLKFLPQPAMPDITTNSDITVLSQAYPISIYWDNDENVYFVELSAFGNAQLHHETWEGAAAAAKVAHHLLITAYRTYGYTLPEVG